jgi:hypothetical protein
MSKLEEIKVLKDTIKYFNSQIEPHDCGWMYTTIDGLKYRIKVLRKEIKQMKPKESWVKGYNKWKNERCPHN